MEIEYDEYDEVYGHSVDDDSCISPTDAQQWMYDRNRGQQSIASFITNNQDIKEEADEDAESVADEFDSKLRRDSDVIRFIICHSSEGVVTVCALYSFVFFICVELQKAKPQ